MEDAFNEREKGFEAKYKLDQERRFKAGSRRNRLLGEWAAARLGLSGADGEAYAADVVRAGLAGSAAVVGKVRGDFAGRGIDAGEDQVRTELERLQGLAMEQIESEYPAALGDDHGRTGG